MFCDACKFFFEKKTGQKSVFWHIFEHFDEKFAIFLAQEHKLVYIGAKSPL